MTEIKYRSGGVFGNTDDVYQQLFCVMCVESIIGEEENHEPDVDDRDAPNILPYKKCGFCQGRSSCGSYTDENVWQCEGCAPEEEEKICGLCDCDLGPDSGNDIIHTSPRGYIYCESCEDEHTYITAFLADDLETIKRWIRKKREADCRDWTKR